MAEDEDPASSPTEDSWTGWKPVLILVIVVGVLPVLTLAVAYIVHRV